MCTMICLGLLGFGFGVPPDSPDALVNRRYKCTHDLPVLNSFIPLLFRDRYSLEDQLTLREMKGNLVIYIEMLSIDQNGYNDSP